MPGGPDYPMDTSSRYPTSGLGNFRPMRANDNIQGIVHTEEGDIRTWVLSSEIESTHRSVYEALAFLDIADVVSETRHQTMLAGQQGLLTRVATIESAVSAIAAAVQAQQVSIDAITSFLGVIVPAWATLTEVQQGDEMGMVRQSAEQLGLVADIIALQLEPGFAHEDVVSMDPPAGTLVARGSTVHVRVNFQG